MGKFSDFHLPTERHVAINKSHTEYILDLDFVDIPKSSKESFARKLYDLTIQGSTTLSAAKIKNIRSKRNKHNNQ